MVHFTPTPLEWRMLADACSTVAKREKARAAKMEARVSVDYLASARAFEILAESCLRNCIAPAE